DGGESEADGWDGANQGFEKLSQGSECTAPRSPLPVLPPRPDMHARQHDLHVLLRKNSGLFYQLRNRARAIRAPRDRRRADGAVLVAAVLDFEEPAGPHPLAI